MAQIEDTTYHQNEFMIALAKHLGLDTTQIAGISCTASSATDPVEIQWDGYALMPVEEFNEILASVNTNSITGEGVIESGGVVG